MSSDKATAIARVGEGLKRDLGSLDDFLVHSIAFADRADLERPFVETSRKGYQLAQDVSSYSLTAVSRMAAPLMEKGGAASRSPISGARGR